MIRIIIIALLALTLANCAEKTYKVKQEAKVEDGRVLNKVPQWFVDAKIDKGLIRDRDADSFIYAVRQCVDFINYTTEPGKRIPGSIIIAMAGIESGWGTSRFALEGNALFGVRTWDATVPQMKAKAMPDADWGVKKYKTKCHSVRDMMEIINRHSAYKEFRAERDKQLKNDTWNYKKLLILLESWSENTEYANLIYQTIVDRKLP